MFSVHSFRVWISVLFFSSSIGIIFIISRIQDFYLQKSIAGVVCVSNALALLLSRHGFRPSSYVVGMVRVFSVSWWLLCSHSFWDSFMTS